VSDRALFTQFKGNAPASGAEIVAFQNTSGIQLRDDYASFLMLFNGGEGFIGQTYAVVWSLQQLVEFNAGYEVAKRAPGLFLFGSDGGEEAFAFDCRLESQPIVSVPFIPLSVENVIPLAASFEGFLQRLYSGFY